VRASGKGGGVRIDEEPVLVETLAFLGSVRAIHSVAVALSGTNPFHPHVPDVTRPIEGRVELDRLEREDVVGRGEKEKAYRAGAAAENGKLGAIIVEVNPQRERITGIGRVERPVFL
jgi:hypothetical protein